MKKRMWAVIALTALALVSCTAAIAAASGQREEETFDARQLSGEGYILTEYDGGLALYRDGEIVLRAPVDVATLRAADRELIRQGIEARTYEEALRLMEDLGA